MSTLIRWVLLETRLGDLLLALLERLTGLALVEVESLAAATQTGG